MNRNSVITAVIIVVAAVLLLFGLRSCARNSTVTIRPTEQQTTYVVPNGKNSNVKISLGSADTTQAPSEPSTRSTRDDAFRAFEARLVAHGGSDTQAQASQMINEQDASALPSQIAPSTSAINTASTASTSNKIVFAPRNSTNGSSTTTQSNATKTFNSTSKIATRNASSTLTTGTSNSTRTSTTSLLGNGSTGTSARASIFSVSNSADAWNIFSPNNRFSLGSSNNLSTGYFSDSGAGCPSINTQQALCGQDGFKTTAMVNGGCPAVVCIIGMK